MTVALKRRLVEQICSELGAELETMRRAADAAHEAATHEEARPENDKDTRSIEAAYLAGAQAERVSQLEDSIGILRAVPLRDFGDGDPIAMGALVDVEVDDQRETHFLLPVAGGLRVEIDGRTLRTITTSSPLGAALLGNTLGDVVELESPRGLREIEIVGLS